MQMKLRSQTHNENDEGVCAEERCSRVPTSRKRWLRRPSPGVLSSSMSTQCASEEVAAATWQSLFFVAISLVIVFGCILLWLLGAPEKRDGGPAGNVVPLSDGKTKESRVRGATRAATPRGTGGGKTATRQHAKAATPTLGASKSDTESGEPG